MERSAGAEGRECPLVEEALEAEGLCLIQEYARRLKEKINEYISTRQIYDLCTGSEQLQGEIRLTRWSVLEDN